MRVRLDFVIEGTEDTFGETLPEAQRVLSQHLRALADRVQSANAAVGAGDLVDDETGLPLGAYRYSILEGSR
jgi:hypothetical protein